MKGKRTNIEGFLKECAKEGISIKEGCERKGVNPACVRKFFHSRKRYLWNRIVKKGRSVGYRWNGVVVFWDRVEKEGEIPRR